MAAVALGAGGTGGQANAVILGDVDGILGGNAGDGDGENVGGFMAAVDTNPLQLGKLFCETIQQRLFPGGICLEAGANSGAGSGKAENSRPEFSV